MSVRIFYFAGLKEALGLAAETVELPANVDTVASVRDWLVTQGRDKLATAKNLRFAVNQELADLETSVKEGDEIAFFPPVTGG